MKKTLWIVMAGALIAAVAATAQTEVLSQNAVGYIKKTLPAGGKFVAMSIPLDSMSNPQIVFGETSVAAEAPAGSIVYFWDTTGQSWIPGLKSTKGWGPAEANYVLQSGEGFFLKGPPASAIDIDVTITGEVPADAMISRGNPGGNAFGTLANPYPVDFAFGTSDVASNAPSGSIVYFWDLAGQSWIPGLKSTKGWGPAEAGREVQAGEGFFLKAPGGPITWDSVKPYTWP